MTCSNAAGPAPASGSRLARTLDATAPGRVARALDATAPGRVLVRVARGIRWYVTSLMGDRAYETYLIHERVHHPDREPLTERQFWRQRQDEQSRNPSARCC